MGDGAYTTPIVIVDIIGDALVVTTDVLITNAPEPDPNDNEPVPDFDRTIRMLGLGLLAVTTVVAGGPIVHFAEGETERGFVDAGLRVVLPVAGFLATCQPLKTDFWCRVGGYGGLLAAQAIDWFYLSRLDEDDQAEPRVFSVSVRRSW